jgi:hypothetical protein
MRSPKDFFVGMQNTQSRILTISVDPAFINAPITFYPDTAQDELIYRVDSAISSEGVQATLRVFADPRYYAWAEVSVSIDGEEIGFSDPLYDPLTANIVVGTFDGDYEICFMADGRPAGTVAPNVNDLPQTA